MVFVETDAFPFLSMVKRHKTGVIRNQHLLYNPKPYGLRLCNVSDHTEMESQFDVFGGERGGGGRTETNYTNVCSSTLIQTAALQPQILVVACSGYDISDWPIWLVHLKDLGYMLK